MSNNGVPTVTSVVATGTGITAGAGDLDAGSVVTLTVNLSAAVAVAGGTPTLSLNDGGVATYTSGTGSNALKFTYAVAAGQNTANLAITAVNLNGATVTTGGSVTVAAGSGQSLTDAHGNVFSFGGVVPGRSDYIILRNGVQYAAGAAVTMTVSNGFVWAYTAENQWYEDNGSYWVSQANGPPAGGSNQSANLTGAVTTLSGPLQIDTTPPTVAQVLAMPGNATETPGGIVTLTLGLSEAVTVLGTPTLSLNDGGIATYTSGTNSNALTFSYTVGTADSSVSALAITQVNLPNGASVKDGAGNVANLAGAVTTLTGLQITAGPTVTSVVATGTGITAGAGDLDAGSVVTLTVNLSAAVAVAGGTPTLSLNDGGVATYTSGTGSNALKFTYAVAAGQNTANLAITAVNLNGATVTTGGSVTVAAGSGQSLTDAHGNVFSFGGVVPGRSDYIILRNGVQYAAGAAVTMTVSNGFVWAYTAENQWYEDNGSYWVSQANGPPAGGSNQSANLTGAVTTLSGPLQIDTTPPIVTSVVGSPSSGDLNAGKSVTLTLGLSEAVTVLGTPTLSLNDGGIATYTSGTNSNALTFSYTVGTADSSVSALAITQVNLPNGASVKDGAGNVANLAGAVTTLSGPLQIDTTPPIVTSVVGSPSSGDLNAGKSVTLTLGLSEAVTVLGTPTLSLNDGGIATYTSGTNSNALTFSYTVGTADSSVSALAITQVNLPNGASVKDGAGNVANLAGAVTTLSGPLQIDTTPPIVTSVVGSPSSGDLNAGKSVTLTLGLSEAVTVLGTPTLSLNDGGIATYTSGTNSNALTFSYTVGTADSSVSALAITQVNLPNGASVKDGAGNVANLAGAVTTLTGLQITAGPTVTSVVATGTGITAGAGDLDAGSVVTLTVNLSAAVAVAGGTPTLSLNDGGVATYTSGTGSNALKFTYAVAAGQNTANLAITAVNLNGATVTTGGSVTVAAGSGQSLTDAHGNVFSFGGVVPGRSDYIILRNGVQYAAGAAVTMTVSNGFVWAYTAENQWYEDNGSYWVSQANGPPAGGSNQSANLTGAVTTLSGPLQIDTTPPTVAQVLAMPGNATETPGGIVTLTLGLSEAVTVLGTPTLSLNDGGIATYTSGTNSNALTFSYTVGTADSSVSALAITQVNLPNGASVKDGAGNVANLAGAATTFSNLAIDVPTALVKPNGLPTLLSSNPLAAGVLFYGVDLGNGTIVDVAPAGPPMIAAGPLPPTLSTAYGSGIGWDNEARVAGDGYYANVDNSIYQNAGSTIQNAVDLAAAGPGAGFTFGCTFVELGGGDGFPALIFGRPALAAEVAPFWNEAFTTDGSNDYEVDLLLNNGSAGQVIGNYDFGSYGTIVSVICTVQNTSSGSGIAKFFAASGGSPGALIAEATISAASTYGFGHDDENQIMFGSVYHALTGLGWNSFNGPVFSGFIAGTAWTDAQAMTWLSNPYELLTWNASPPVAPTVTSVAATGTGITAGVGDLGVGAVVTLTVNLNAGIVVAGGTPTLSLNDTGVATYTGSSGSNALSFKYTVAAGQNTSDLAITAVNLNGATVMTGLPTVTAGSGQFLTDANGNIFTFGSLSGSDYIILRNGAQYAAGAAATMTLSNGVIWAHTAEGQWYEDNGSYWVSQATGPSTSGAGQSVNLAGAVTTLAGPLQIDTTPPTVTQVVAVPGSGTVNPGGVVILTLDLSEAVTVIGTPTLSLNDGGIATYTSGTNSNALTFSYTVGATDSTVSVLAITHANLPNGATIKDAAGNAANLAGAVTTFSGLAIDPPPVVTSIVVSPSIGDLSVGKTVAITIDLNDAVVVAGGTPTLALNDGGTAIYIGGSGSNALTFSYTVAVGQNAADLAVTSVDLNGATVMDSASHTADLAGAVTALPGSLQINTTALTVTAGTTLDFNNTTMSGGTLVNSGTIDSTGNSTLTGVSVTNSGLIEASNGALIVNTAAVTNTGFVAAEGGNVTIIGLLGGNAEIAGTSILEFGDATATNVTFLSGSTGMLKLDHSQAYTGTVAGLAPGNFIDLADIGFGASTTLGYTTNNGNSGGTLSVSDGSHSASIALLVNYIAGSFVTSSDGHGGTLITDPGTTTTSNGPQLTQPVHA